MGLKELKNNKRISFGDKLRRRRLQFGYKSQADFAHKIGSNRVTVSRWESGASGVGEEFHEAIKQVLDVDDSFFDQPPITLVRESFTKKPLAPRKFARPDVIVEIITELTSLTDIQLSQLLGIIHSIKAK
jgi:transcriptional regulator with XRE-family HTH domain